MTTLRATQTEELLPALFKELNELVIKRPPRKTTWRANTGPGRTQAYGMLQRGRGGMGIGLAANNEKYPEVWAAARKLARTILPDTMLWTSMMLNMNYEARPHKDINNIGESLVVSWGDYTGGELVVVDDDGIETDYNICMRPVIMDASKITHYVKPITSGTRYSIIFFRTRLTKAFYQRYGENLTLDNLIDLLPEKLPGQKNYQIRIPI
jgi:hypothetical protein